MTEGKVEVFLSYKEPEYRDNLLWLRPYLDREGYELLYYGSNGWAPLINYCGSRPSLHKRHDIEYEHCPIVTDMPVTSKEEIERVEDIPKVYIPMPHTPCNCKNRK